MYFIFLKIHKILLYVCMKFEGYEVDKRWESLNIPDLICCVYFIFRKYWEKEQQTIDCKTEKILYINNAQYQNVIWKYKKPHVQYKPFHSMMQCRKQKSTTFSPWTHNPWFSVCVIFSKLPASCYFICLPVFYSQLVFVSVHFGPWIQIIHVWSSDH